MAITSFIPTIWSETLLEALNSQYIGVQNCSRDFEGEIKDKGQTVKIGCIGSVNVFDYTKDTDMDAPETLSDSQITLTIDQAKEFNFQIDAIDKAQATPKLMQAAMKQAASALADVADRYVYSLYTGALSENKISVSGLTVDNVVATLASLRKSMFANSVGNNMPVALEVSPDVAAIIMQAKVLQATDNTDVIENGALGKLFGFDIYVSPNVVVDGANHMCVARTKRAVAFAAQLNDVEAYRPESRFADAVKGLHLYGAKIVYPAEYFVLSVSLG